jgi:hypothetical protein
MDPHGELVGLTKDADPSLAEWVKKGAHCSHYAMEVLGLTDYEADALFAGNNSAAMVRQCAERAAGEKL